MTLPEGKITIEAQSDGGEFSARFEYSISGGGCVVIATVTDASGSQVCSVGPKVYPQKMGPKVYSDVFKLLRHFGSEVPNADAFESALNKLAGKVITEIKQT